MGGNRFSPIAALNLPIGFQGRIVADGYNPAELNGFTWARELAQAVVFHSPFLCYADNPAWYLRNPAVETFRAIPAVWNETRVLPGPVNLTE